MSKISMSKFKKDNTVDKIYEGVNVKTQKGHYINVDTLKGFFVEKIKHGSLCRNPNGPLATG